MDSILFFKEAIRNLRTSGTFFPSSKYLVKRIVDTIDFDTAQVIVEFGPGNGIITKEILKRIQPQTKLIAFEINESFLETLNQIENKQLFIENSSAENIASVLEKHGYTNTDCIISSLPLTNIPKKISNQILNNAFNTIKDNGLFVQYQYSPTYYKKLKTVFNKKVKLSFEVFNFPPAFVYIARK